MDECMDRWKEWLDGWICGYMDGPKGRWGWVNTWMDGCTDKQMKRCF